MSLPRPSGKRIPLPEFERIDGKPQAQLYDVAPFLVNSDNEYGSGVMFGAYTIVGREGRLMRVGDRLNASLRPDD